MSRMEADAENVKRRKRWTRRGRGYWDYSEGVKRTLGREAGHNPSANLLVLKPERIGKKRGDRQLNAVS